MSHVVVALFDALRHLRARTGWNSVCLTSSKVSEEETLMAYETLLVETDGGVGIITLNRPEALNALNRKLCAELMAVLAGWGKRSRDRLRDHYRGRACLRSRRRHQGNGAAVLHGRLPGRHVRRVRDTRCRPSASR